MDNSSSISYLTPANTEFFRTEGGFAGLKYDGKEYKRVKIMRIFPLTEPDSYLSVREPDQKVKEIGIIRTLNDFPAETAEIISEQLNLFYFMPKINRIYNIKEEYGFGYFHVGTDKGDCHFTVHIYGRAFVRLSDVRYIITDIDGNRFELPDVSALSITERKNIDLYL